VEVLWMIDLKSGPCAVLELRAETLKGLRSLFDAIERALNEGKTKVALELCRTSRSLFSGIATCVEHELSADTFQDLLRQVSLREKAEDTAAIAM
jgi:hypothetical protein